MKLQTILPLLTGLGFLFIISCTSSIPEPITDNQVPYQTTPYPLITPKGFPPMEIPEANPLTLEGVALGRRLYYDPILEKDSSRACASCHLQSIGFQIDNGKSQVVAHANMGWNNRFMWNGGFEGTLEDVMTFEVEDFFETDISRLNNNPTYQKLFKEAFDVDVITSKEAAYALAQFARIMISGNSRFDQALRGEISLTPLEEEGKELFFTEKADCFHCHGNILLTDNTPRNNGLDANPDSGLMKSTGNPKDLGKFKTPTLRNIALTAPYMHDGRYQTLEEVIDFYSSDVQNTGTVDPLMVYAHLGGVQLTDSEKEALLAFLLTFTDESYTTNSELASPF